MLIFKHGPSKKSLFSSGPALITLPSAGDTTAPGRFGTMRSGSLKKKQANNVTTSPVRDSMTNPNRANINVANPAASIRE
jgi:hypothetical protein